MQDFKVGDKVLHKIDGVGIVVGFCRAHRSFMILVELMNPHDFCHDGQMVDVVDEGGEKLTFSGDLYYFYHSRNLKNLGSTL